MKPLTEILNDADRALTYDDEFAKLIRTVEGTRILTDKPVYPEVEIDTTNLATSNLMERQAVAQRAIDFSRKQAGISSEANIYDAWVRENIVRLLTWHHDAVKAETPELASMAFDRIRAAHKVGA